MLFITVNKQPSRAACCYSASGTAELKLDHLKLMLARQLERPLTAAKGSGMKQKDYSKPVQCTRTITKLQQCMTGGVTNGEEGASPDPQLQQQGFGTKGTVKVSFKPHVRPYWYPFASQ